ncbi:hypothetical protein ABW20_dc0100331 [Dactylellina cionopaga]|nr:hypothetical protein ABW20_dc0100331 [Dactylellina cionopaga]
MGAAEFPEGTTTIDVMSTIVVGITTVTSTVSETVTVGGGSATVTEVTSVTIGSTQTVPTTTSITNTIASTVWSSTTITTTISTTIYIIAATPDVSCGNNAGLEVAIYDNPYGRVNGNDPYTIFAPGYFKTAAPYGTSQTTTIGIISNAEGTTPYGMTSRSSPPYVLNHRGYFYAPKTDTYTFTFGNVDDIAFFWTGDKAYVDWTRANADLEVLLGPNVNSGSKQIALTAGTYTPLRIMVADGLGSQPHFTFTITDSAGTKYLQYGAASPYLVAFSCDSGDNAGAYLNPFGAEAVRALGPPDTSCSNAGVQVAIYDDPFIGTDATYSNFNAQYYRSQTPYGIKVLSYIGLLPADRRMPNGFTPNPGPPPDNSVQYTLNYRGYFYATRNATYTFDLNTADNIGLLWLNATAKAGWTRANADGEIIFDGPSKTSPSKKITVALTEGTYYPVRLMMGSWSGGASVGLNIYDDTMAYYVRTSGPSPYLVRFACDRTVFPYPDPYGEEP